MSHSNSEESPVFRRGESSNVVGSQHGSASYREGIARWADPQKLPHQRSIDPSIQGFLAENFERFVGGQSFPVGAVIYQRVVHIGNLQNARFQGDFLAVEAVRIARAIHSLVMVSDDGKNLSTLTSVLPSK